MTQSNKMPLVIIFGRTNVGKSTLFNKLLERKQAITSSEECTTRDSNRGVAEWEGIKMELIDTGGIVDEKAERIVSAYRKKKTSPATIEEAVQNQALEFLKQSDVILLVVDNRDGVLPQDEILASFLKKNYPKKTLVVANKIDNPKFRTESAVFNQLDLGEPYPISAFTGSGTGDLLDRIVENLPPESSQQQVKEEKIEGIDVCILGKPNVGKSSLLNSFLKEKRVIVNDLPHTTREPQDTELVYEDQRINLVDTAGIHRRGTKTKGLEKFGINKSLRALKRSKIALLVLDIASDITHQDAKLIEEVFKRDKSLIIVANKWDQVEEKDTKEFTQYIQKKFPYAQWAPIKFVSAATGSKVKKILNLILEVDEQRKTELSQSQLDKLLSQAVKKHPPAKDKGIRAPYIYKINQTQADPPKFVVKIRTRDTLHFSYIRFIKNQLREKFGFLGTPIEVEVIHGQKDQ